MKFHPGYLILSILVLTSCTPSHIVQQMEMNSVQIKKFNYDAFDRGGRIRLKDSSAYVGHQFHLTDSNLTWTDSTTSNEFSVPSSDVFSVDIIKKADSRDAAGGAVKGILLGGAIGMVAGRLMTPYKPETGDREESNSLEVLASMITIGVVGSVIGGFIGVGSGHHDTRITKFFTGNAPAEMNSDRSIGVWKMVNTTPRADSSIMKSKVKLTTDSITKKMDLTGISRSKKVLSPAAGSKTAFAGLSWSVANTILPVYVGTKSLGDKSYRIVPMGYGLIVGPSIGHFYSSDKKRGWIGIGIRAAGFALYAIGKGKSDGMKTAGIILMSAGIGYSLYTVPSSVREYNARQSWSIAPVVDPNRKSAALAVHFQF